MIVWLASYPKSENTLLRSILSSYFYSKEGEFSFKNLNYISQFPLTSQFMSAGINIDNDKEVFKNFINVQNLLNEIHDQFIAVVKKGRGDRLSTDESIFSGLFWDGNSAIKLGLVDNLGSVGSVARDIVGNENIVDFTTKASFGERIAERFGAGVGVSFSNTVLNRFKNNTVIK